VHAKLVSCGRTPPTATVRRTAKGTARQAKQREAAQPLVSDRALIRETASWSASWLQWDPSQPEGTRLWYGATSVQQRDPG
jgi:hypothetical protein